MMNKIFKGRKVIITGHTGFKGSWLTLWLHKMGAKIIGVSLKDLKPQSHFNYLNLRNKLSHNLIDIRNYKKIDSIIKNNKPDFIFHLAAQALVKKSYKLPKFTIETNALGTLNILESLRSYSKKCTLVIITSDKVYRNFEIKRGYKENDILGGFDPYSASKASAELIIQSYIKSYFPKNGNVRIGIARAGNVLGGGDWSEDRLIPDCIRSWSKNTNVIIRNPNSTRPWQHVLEAIYGYLILAKSLNRNSKLHGEAFNFGPNEKNVKKVGTVIKLMRSNWEKVKYKIKKNNINKKTVYESKLLKLNSNKAKRLLSWKCKLTFKDTIKMVVWWYKNFYTKRFDVKHLTLSQIGLYEKIIKKN